METRSADNRIWTKVSDDGKHAAAGMSLGPVGTKPGGGGEDQPCDGHGQYLGTAGPGGISGGREVRGKVTPPQKPKYPPPPRQPHLVFSIESHALRNPDGGVMADDAYSGRGQPGTRPRARMSRTSAQFRKATGGWRKSRTRVIA